GIETPVSILDAEAVERGEERALGLGERDAILGTSRAGEARLHRPEIELHDLRVRRERSRLVEQELLLAVRLHQRDLIFAAAGEAQVAERLLVDGEEAARRPVLGRH